MKFIRDNRILMGVAASNGTLNLFKAAIEAVAILYIVRELEVPPAMLGVIFAIGSLSLIPAALAASRLPRRFGVGRTLLLTVGVIVLSDLVVPILAGPLWFILVALLVHETFLATGFISFSVSQVSLRQSLTPDSMQGRMNSLMTVSARSAVPIGALIGGVMGEFIGLREALFIAVVGEAASVIWLIYFGVWRVKEMPSLDAAHQN
jgi:MFS family permease